MTASELAKSVIENVQNGTADEAFAASTATEFNALDPMQMYHCVVQITGALRESKHKEGLQAFNLLLNKQPTFIDAMARLNKAKEAGELAKPA